MYAVFKVSGIQFSAQEGDVIKVPLQQAGIGDSIDITDVMLVNEGGKTLVGTPYVPQAKIQAEILGHGKDDKVQIYKYKRRTKYRRRAGHRQDFSEIKIGKIIVPAG